MSEIQPAPKRNFIARIFISPDEPRLRAGWRLLLQTLFSVYLIQGALHGRLQLLAIDRFHGLKEDTRFPQTSRGS